jgi:hypothetical protein
LQIKDAQEEKDFIKMKSILIRPLFGFLDTKVVQQIKLVVKAKAEE